MDGVMFFQVCIMIIEVGVALLLLASINRLNKVMQILSPVFQIIKGAAAPDQQGGETK